MLDNERYNRARSASIKYPRRHFQTFLDQEITTQLALNTLGVENEKTPPSKVHGVGRFYMRPDSALTLRVPFEVEVLGTPGAGKTTIINRYLNELWLEDKRHMVHFVQEGARTIRDASGYMRFEDPLAYSIAAGIINQAGVIGSAIELNTGMRMALSDRGSVDRKAFRRAMFSRGEVNPILIGEERIFEEQFEFTPFQKAALIMLMVRPEVSLARKPPKEGEKAYVRNMDFLSLLYEQYWKIHLNILEGQIPFMIYTCIDAEGNPEEVYQQFKFAVDSTLTLPEKVIAAFSNVFPEELNELKQKVDSGQPPQSEAEKVLSHKLGGRVLIVGGDEMQDPNEILNRAFVEVIPLTAKGEGIVNNWSPRAIRLSEIRNRLWPK